ncbi:nucleoside 2-deoxyribosyltransferase [Geomonas sp. RF6]|uniref:nucleoside 2-deoxyribosyltransferase n=1 Tax=Geomonas sp. RF6 TaxID=2897342 RepID=UPI001E63E743|nr:nucleoside 2-deoxyribosyltransferase [Geomonas sp. RF6]UFS71109.1 nucleoside 2-deoxyribosyltransferase [Geomonas sp. RF6]
MKRMYLASPLGFSPENAPYLNRIKVKVASQGFEIFDPWEQKHFASKISAALSEPDFAARIAAFREISSRIGSCNEAGIRGADVVLAVLDGAEVDSGTASEIGFGCALGKKCYGLRTDLRDSGDFAGIPVNLQVLHFIERSGGKLFRQIDDISIPF